jgi:hypothetical protein
MGGWAPGPVCRGTEYLVPTGIRSPDRPTRSKSLYRLSHPGQKPTVVDEWADEMEGGGAEEAEHDSGQSVYGQAAALLLTGRGLWVRRYSTTERRC